MNKGSKLIEKLKSIKHIEIIIAVIALAIMLLIYFSSTSDNKSNSSATKGTSLDYCAKMETDIEQLIAKIKGAGEAKVVIGWESENVNVSDDSGYSDSNFGFSNWSSSRTIIQSIPKARSAVVVCQGGENASVKISIIMAVSKLLNISTDNVLVYSMKK